jgi:hypothetical protein
LIDFRFVVLLSKIAKNLNSQTNERDTGALIMFYDYNEIQINLNTKKDVMKTVRAFEEKLNEYAETFTIFADDLETKSGHALKEELDTLYEILFKIDLYLARNVDCLDVKYDPDKYVKRAILRKQTA